MRLFPLNFCCAALLACAFGRAADPPSPRLTGTPLLAVWQAETYGASPINWRVLQHPKTGLIYVANNYGVLEFDGAAWRLMPLPRGGPVRTLLVDRQGTLWAGGMGELCTLEPDATGRLQMVDQAPRLPAYAGPADAEDESEGGTIDPHRIGVLARAAVGDDGVYFRMPGRIVRFAADRTVTVWPLAVAVGHLWWLDGALHINTNSRGIERFEQGALHPLTSVRGAQVVAAAADTSTPGSPPQWRLLSGRGPTWWNRADPAPAAIPPETAALFNDDPVTGAVLLPDGRAVYATTRSGVRIFDAANRPVQHIDRAHGLPGDRVNGVCLDREGGVWLAMHFAIARIQLDGAFALHGEAQGLDGGPREVTRARGRLFVTHGEGLAWRDDATGRFHAVEGVRGGTHRVSVVGERIVVAGTSAFELPPSGPPRRLRDSLHYQLRTAPGTGGAVVASTAQTVWLWPSLDQGDQRVPLATLTNGASQLLDGPDGALWAVLRNGEVWRVETQGGLAPASPGRRLLPDAPHPPVRPRDGLHLATIGGELLATSAQWVLRYDAPLQKFVPETRLGTGRGPVAACDTAGGGAWFYFDGAEARFTHVWADAHGAWQQESYPAYALGDLAVNALYYDDVTRTLWIAGQGALVSFSPGSATFSSAPPLSVFVYDVSDASGQTLWSSQATGPRAAAPLALTAAQDALRFRFSAPAYVANYRGGIATEFRTRLDGVDRDWTPWSRDARREFTSLPAGALTLHLQARDGRARLSAPAAFRLERAPPWWLTAWAQAGFGALGLGAITGLVKLRTHALRRKNVQLEAIVARRTTELQERNGELARLHRLELDEKISARLGEEKARLEVLRYQLNPHFLFNALNAFPGLVAEDPKTAGAMALSLGDFCRRMLMQHDDGRQRVREELAMLEAYLNVEKIRWSDSLRVEVAADPAVLEVLIPSFLLLPLVENAIKHGGATSPGVLHLRLAAQAVGGGIAFEVANSGRWSAAAATGVASTGIGLENLRRRLERYYPDAHTFTIGPANEGVVARLFVAAAVPHAAVADRVH